MDCISPGQAATPQPRRSGAGEIRAADMVASASSNRSVSSAPRCASCPGEPRQWRCSTRRSEPGAASPEAANLLGRHVPRCRDGEHSRQPGTEAVAQSLCIGFGCVAVTPVIGVQVPPGLDILRPAGQVINRAGMGFRSRLPTSTRSRPSSMAQIPSTGWFRALRLSMEARAWDRLVMTATAAPNEAESIPAAGWNAHRYRLVSKPHGLVVVSGAPGAAGIPAAMVAG
jgi:hypothetical protein